MDGFVRTASTIRWDSFQEDSISKGPIVSFPLSARLVLALALFKEMPVASRIRPMVATEAEESGPFGAIESHERVAFRFVDNSSQGAGHFGTRVSAL